MSKRHLRSGRRGRLAAIATAAVAVGALGTGASAQDPVTMDYWYQSSGPEGLAIHEAAVAAYMEANPGVTITVTPYSFDDMQRILPVTLDGRTGPDVGSISWGAQATDLFAVAGHLVDLTDHGAAAGWLDRYPADLLAYANQGVPGRIFGVPPEQATVGVYYNSEIFEELGLTPPPRSLSSRRSWRRSRRRASRPSRPAASTRGRWPMCGSSSSTPTCPSSTSRRSRSSWTRRRATTPRR